MQPPFPSQPNHRMDATTVPTPDIGKSNAVTAEDKGINMHSASVPAAVLHWPERIPLPWRRTNWVYFVNADIANDFAERRAEYHSTPARDFYLHLDGNNGLTLSACPCRDPPLEADKLMVVDKETLKFLRSLAKDARPASTIDPASRPMFHPLMNEAVQFRNTIWRFVNYSYRPARRDSVCLPLG